MASPVGGTPKPGAPATAPRAARPSPVDLEAARGRTIDDVIAPGLRVLFCGINPGLYSGATGFHFARPGNRFWKALQLAGFTDRVLLPADQTELLGFGLGITNLVRRTTATAAELEPGEMRAGAVRLRRLVEQARPGWLAIVGIDAYRVGFNAPRAHVGGQPERIGESGVWVLPNPSGLNAHYQLPELGVAFAALREAAFAE